MSMRLNARPTGAPQRVPSHASQKGGEAAASERKSPEPYR